MLYKKGIMDYKILVCLATVSHMYRHTQDLIIKVILFLQDKTIFLSFSLKTGHRLPPVFLPIFPLLPVIFLCNYIQTMVCP